jgi:YidC/Oxa1 family membrane protein insertase
VGDDYEEESKGGGFFSKRESLVTEKGPVNWFGIMSRYFLVIMMPKEEKGSGVIFDNRENEGYRIASRFPLPKIDPGSREVRSFTVYIGEKKKESLVAVDETMKKASDINLFIEPIRWFVLWSLKKINILFGNMGWSLVFFSLLTKLVFLPLTRKSTESMKKMQELNPQLTKIKEKYKDKPDVMQQKMMELYKENKVNPMGGCCPLLLQMPFFLALYSALINSIDLWNAPFILWMQDLSMPDTVATVAGFNINILPLVMTISTILQQKLTTVDTGQQQKMMMYMLPLILIFIFWTMPSGLVLYWTLQNLFQVLHQVIINFRSKKA